MVCESKHSNRFLFFFFSIPSLIVTLLRAMPRTEDIPKTKFQSIETQCLLTDKNLLFVVLVCLWVLLLLVFFFSLFVFNDGLPWRMAQSQMLSVGVLKHYFSLFLNAERFQYDSLKQENMLILIVYLPQDQCE